jgi:hypothetical protein
MYQADTTLPHPTKIKKKLHKMFLGRNRKPHTQVDDDVQHVGQLLRSYIKKHHGKLINKNL